MQLCHQKPIIKMFFEYKKQIHLIFFENQDLFSPAFNSKIIFNSKGINHLLYKGNRSRRETERIEINLRLLPRAIKLLKRATFWQEESNYKTEDIFYKFWAFEAVVDERRIKVIIRQVGNGNKHFWSVIPAWRKDRFGIVNARKKNLED